MATVFSIDITLPNKQVVPLQNLPTAITVGELKAVLFDEVGDALHQPSIDSYTLGVSSWALLSDLNVSVVSSSSSISDAIEQGTPVKLTLFGGPKTTGPPHQKSSLRAPGTSPSRLSSVSFAPTNPDQAEDVFGDNDDHNDNDDDDLDQLSPPPPPSQPQNQSQTPSVAQVSLPDGTVLLIPVSRDEPSESTIQSSMQEVYKFMASLPSFADMILRKAVISSNEVPDTGFDAIPRFEATATRSVRPLDRKEYEMLVKQNKSLRGELEKMRKENEQLTTAGQNTQGRLTISGERPDLPLENPEDRARIPVQLVFPGDYAMILGMSLDMPLWAVKAWAWRLGSDRELLNGPVESHSLKEEDSEEPLFDESKKLGELDWEEDEEDGLRRGTLRIVEKPDVARLKVKKKSDAEKILAVHIGHTIGRPLAWAHGDDEVTLFRHSISKVVAEELDHAVLSSGMYNVNANVLPPPHPPYVPDKFMIRVRMLGAEGYVTIMGNPEESVDSHISRALKKFSIKGAQVDCDPTRYIVKVTGRAEYLENEVELASFLWIREKLKMKERIELLICTRDELIIAEEDPREVDHDFFQDWHDELRTYEHDVITIKQRAWDETMVMSIRDLTSHLRLRIIGVDGLSFETFTLREVLGDRIKKNDKVADFVTNVYVVAGIVHGGDLIASEMTTRKIPTSSSPRWYEWLQCDDLMWDHMPRSTRVCFTVFVELEKSSKEIIEYPLGWVNMQLVDYRNHLQSGVFTLRLWPDGAANPIGTCMDNARYAKPATLTIEFDRYALPVVFPIDEPIDESEGIGVRDPTAEDMSRLKFIINTDPLYKLTMSDRELLITYRHFIRKTPKALAKFLNAVSWNVPQEVRMAHTMLSMWAKLSPVEALELLDARFSDAKVRKYAVKMLEQLTDDELEDFLLQLVQTLKYEPYHDSALTRFLLCRALRNRIRLGHALFWLLRSETHVPEVAERFSLMLEAYLRGCGRHRVELEAQATILKDFVSAAEYVKKFPLAERKPQIQTKLKTVKFPERLQLPLQATMEVSGLKIEKCKSMDSKKVPLWLGFINADTEGSDVFVMFKAGDDLRQDMLTLQLIRIMDKIWQADGLDLYMSPYRCVATGDEEGMLELVLNSDTTANVTRAAAGAMGAFSETPLAEWLKRENNNDEVKYKEAVDLFTMSCAGYCVATYVLGIGDRHNDNVMLKRNGQLFHIDFGHFLGNFKRWKGIKRERAPFVFTPDFAYVMGGRGTPKYQEFVQLCCRAYNICRKHAHMFFNLFGMMLSTGIPELTSSEDLNYLREAFALDLTDDQASKRFADLIDISLNTKATRFNNAIHIIAHS